MMKMKDDIVFGFKNKTVVCSRDVRLNEKIINCGKAVQLPIIDEDKTNFESKNKKENTFKTILEIRQTMNSLLLFF